MKLGEILYEADYDAYLAREADKHNGGDTKVTTSDDVYDVDLIIVDTDGNDIGGAPETIEIEVSDIDSWNANPRARHEDEEEIEYNYDNASATLSKAGEKELNSWLKKNKLVQTDIEFDISFENEEGSVTISVKDKK